MATRRHVLTSTAGLACAVWLRPASASAQELAVAIRAFVGGAPVQAGRVVFDVAPLVENGNVVPVTVTVQSPMTVTDHVKAIAIFNERNPQRDVVRAAFGPACGRAQLDTRIRLATSQRLVALARLSDGSQWSAQVDVVVTLAACIEP